MADSIVLAILILANIGFFFFLYWQPRKRRKKQAQGLFFESSKGPIFYQVHGKKRNTVLLLHGLGASSYCWRKLIPLMEKEFRVITIDLYGFGKSHKDSPFDIGLDDHATIIKELLDELDVGYTHVVGNSMGAHIGFWLAKRFPHRIGKLVALSPAAYPKLVPEYIKKMKWISNWTPWVVNHNVVRGMLINVLGNPHNIDTEMVENYLEPYLDPKAHVSFAAALQVIEDERVYNSLISIDHHVLTLWGERDKVIPRNVINDIITQLPYVELKTHPKSGHCPMEEHPDWCAELIAPFLKS
ncbi:MAG: alpha/beta hydrolase [Bdellovibrionales bacterium]|nr:alpha/beta hydrolase [Bdellovibrionales bacterium]NQZ17965.1 alpha/beta hydrolase [Bdellovibrionales bacterium]